MPDKQTPTHLLGTVAAVGTSRGKTMAAWDGVPVGEAFVLIQCEHQHKSVHAWFPDGAPPQAQADLLGKRVRLSGRWQAPPEAPPLSIHEPRQAPIAPMDTRTLEAHDALLSVLTQADPSGDGAPGAQAPVSDLMEPVGRSRHFEAAELEILPDV